MSARDYSIVTRAHIQAKAITSKMINPLHMYVCIDTAQIQINNEMLYSRTKKKKNNDQCLHNNNNNNNVI